MDDLVVHKSRCSVRCQTSSHGYSAHTVGTVHLRSIFLHDTSPTPFYVGHRYVITLTFHVTRYAHNYIAR